jgi:hypothetical protein
LPLLSIPPFQPATDIDTTSIKADPKAQASANLIKQDFSAATPNEKWLGGKSTSLKQKI